MKPNGEARIHSIEQALTSLFLRPDLQLVILFGSTAKDLTHRDSDIDLAFLFDGPADVLELTNEASRLLGSDRVDVVDLRRASPLLGHAAATEGRLIYERVAGSFQVFRSLAFRRYVDTKKLRDARAGVVRNFLRTRGLS
jgi:predicted nucleotidyltransferase